MAELIVIKGEPFGLKTHTKGCCYVFLQELASHEAYREQYCI